MGPRRVPGLRRVEVAVLAGVSIEYYSKLERGALAGVLAQMLDAISQALKIDDAERAHLFHGRRRRRHRGPGAPHWRATKRWTPGPPSSGPWMRSPARRSSSTAGWTCAPPTARPGLSLTICSAEPASATAQARTLLGTWEATQRQTTAHPS